MRKDWRKLQTAGSHAWKGTLGKLDLSSNSWIRAEVDYTLYAESLKDRPSLTYIRLFFNTWAKTQVGKKLRFSTKLSSIFAKLRSILPKLRLLAFYQAVNRSRDTNKHWKIWNLDQNPKSQVKNAKNSDKKLENSGLKLTKLRFLAFRKAMKSR